MFIDARPLQEQRPGASDRVWQFYSHPEGVASLSPGLLYSATVGNGTTIAQPQRGCGSVPQMTLIPFYVVLARRCPTLTLLTVTVATLSGLERNPP